MKSISRFLLFLLFILVVLAAFLFTIKNPEPVQLWLGIDLSPRPLSVWLIGTFIAGGLIGVVLGAGLWRRLKSRLVIRQLNQTIVRQTEEISLLRSRLSQSASNPGE